MILRLALSLLLVHLMSACCRPDASAEPADPPLAVGEPVPEQVLRRLEDAGWSARVGGDLALWVCVARQRLVGIRDGRVVCVYPCSTAKNGTGNREGSYCTPLGWHRVVRRYGKGKPLGAVFKERRYTGQQWDPASPDERDLILTRILWLEGLEPGLNRGPGIDSFERYIYIHGTPAEDKIGTPASHGCVRLRNADVIELFEQTPQGTHVLITER